MYGRLVSKILDLCIRLVFYEVNEWIQNVLTLKWFGFFFLKSQRSSDVPVKWFLRSHLFFKKKSYCLQFHSSAFGGREVAATSNDRIVELETIFLFFCFLQPNMISRCLFHQLNFRVLVQRYARNFYSLKKIRALLLFF